MDRSKVKNKSETQSRKGKRKAQSFFDFKIKPVFLCVFPSFPLRLVERSERALIFRLV